MNGRQRKIAVVGLGYVGLPVLMAFGKKLEVTGLDIDARRVEQLKAGFDNTGEIPAEEFQGSHANFSSDPTDLKGADFIIVAVPTPIDTANRPDLRILVSASKTVGQNLSKGAIVVYESTVYPGTTEDVCVPVLEKESGLECGKDFWVGYSPERINPGDREHTFTTITKVVSGQTPEVLDIVAEVYSSVVDAGVFRAASIKAAEAAKVIENTQRDLNIALMNELSIIFRKMDIDTNDVLAAAGTKWNFLRFSPGLVGGHCIGVDPYYLTHKAEELGYHPQVILAGRRINDGMGHIVADQVILRLARRGVALKNSKVTVLGLTFKENVPDLRNSGVARIIGKLKEYGVSLQVHDPLADQEEALHEYGVKLIDVADLEPASAVILAVSHRQFVAGGWPFITSLLDSGEGVVADVKGVLAREQKPDAVDLWRM